ncbi:MAG TPA: winged helix-turn-helix domain-containing protein, partial [Terriglobales bacterium]|nr:winged helix-turn-helix domain-containing protein [Terriglobales bacterium]
MSPASSPVRFGSFELDLQSGELRKQGLKIRLADQPLQVLQLLLESRGEVVTRDELQRKLWSSDTFVDFEHSLNAAVKRLREALGDAAENPKFIETLPRHGYRFIAALEPAPANPPAITPAVPPKIAHPRWSQRLVFAALIVSGAISYILLHALWQRFHPPAAPIRAIAVLPLLNLSEDTSQEYFSDGMTEALISELSRVRSLRVISRQSVMRYKGTTKSLPQIARELSVDAVVEGSATRDTDMVRISVQLIRVHPEEHLWARSYERQMHDVLSLQSEVARAIVVEIRAQLAPEEWEHLSQSRSVNPVAYDAYLRGRYKLGRWDPHMREAIDDFEQSVALDPDYAPAYVGLADSYILMTYMDSMAPTEALTKAQAAVTHALELDAASADAYRAMGSARARFLQWSGAQSAYARALQLNPNSAQIHASYGWYLTWLGHFDEALREERHALERDPMSLFALRTVG